MVKSDSRGINAPIPSPSGGRGGYDKRSSKKSWGSGGKGSGKTKPKSKNKDRGGSGSWGKQGECPHVTSAASVPYNSLGETPDFVKALAAGRF